MSRVSAYRGGGPAEIDLGQFGRALRQSFRRNADAGSDRASEKISRRGHGIKRGCRPKINDAGRSAVQIIARCGIDNPVRPHLPRVITKNPDARFAGAVDDKGFTSQKAPADFYKHPCQRRHYGRDGNSLHIGRGHLGLTQQPYQQRAIFILHPAVIGGKTPAGAQRVPVIQPESYICVPDINRKQHKTYLRITNYDLRIETNFAIGVDPLFMAYVSIRHSSFVIRHFASAGLPAASNPPRPRQFWHFPLPCG
jgi:hypothetical protein